MANTLNNAEKWSPKLIEIMIDNSYISPFITTNVEWLGAKKFHFTQMSVKGYKAHDITGGWNRQNITQNDNVYTLEQDRDVEFFVDKREVDETNQTASAQNISEVFTETQSVPEQDAYFFSKVATKAIAASLKSETQLSTITKSNVVAYLQGIISKVRRYRNKGLVVYVRPEIMDALAIAPEFNRNIDVTSIVQSGKAIQTRITTLDGVPLVEIIDIDRFCTAFDFSDGFAKASSAKDINALAATPLTTKFVPKINSIYMFAPGDHTEGDGYLYQNRAFYDTFVFPNGKDNKIDSIFVDYDPGA